MGGTIGRGMRLRYDVCMIHEKRKPIYFTPSWAYLLASSFTFLLIISTIILEHDIGKIVS